MTKTTLMDFIRVRVGLGLLRVNDICTLRRENSSQNQMLWLDISSYGDSRSIPINSREYEGIIKEIILAVNDFMRDSTNKLISQTLGDR